MTENKPKGSFIRWDDDDDPKEPDCPMCGDFGYVSPGGDVPYDIVCGCEAGKAIVQARQRGNVSAGDVLKECENPTVFPVQY